jgi:hypothetical protein
MVAFLQHTKSFTMKKTLKSFSAILFSVVLFTACTKDDVPAGIAQLMVLHQSPNAGNVDVSANGSSMGTISYPNNTGYKPVATGTTNVKVAASGTTTNYINTNIDLQANNYYSVYLVDSATKAKAVATRDDLSAPAAGKAKVRFFHFAPGASAVDIKLVGTTITSFSNRSFNDVSTNASLSAFQEVDAGVLNVSANLAGSSTTVISATPITLTVGKIYTVIARGFATGTGSQALGVTLITHN